MGVAKARERYHSLDAMRGVAAFSVAAYHLGQRWNDDTSAGYLAVDLFFVLSGFVIALSYTDRLARETAVSRFLRLRLVRLYPLYALGLILGIAKLAVGRLIGFPLAASVGSLPCAIASGALMLPDPCSVELFPLNGPSWSLFFELAINLAFGLILWRGSRGLLACLVGVSAILLVTTIGPPDYANIGWAWHNFAGGVVRATFSFCAGILLFRARVHERRIESPAALLPIVGMAVILGVRAPIDRRAASELIAILAAFPLLVCAGSLLEMPGRVARRVCAVLGDLSYPVYSIHWPLIALMVPAANALRLSRPVATGIFLAVLVPIGWSAGWLDRIVRRWVSGWRDGGRAEPADRRAEVSVGSPVAS